MLTGVRSQVPKNAILERPAQVNFCLVGFIWSALSGFRIRYNTGCLVNHLRPMDV